MKVVKDSTGDAVIYPFLSQGFPEEHIAVATSIQVDGERIALDISPAVSRFYVGGYSIEEAIQLLKALQEAVSIAQYNRHQAQLSADAKAVQE